MQVDELAAELAQRGRERFEARYGRWFLVLSDAGLAEDVSMFVNTATRDTDELLAGGREVLDVRPLVPRVRSKAKSPSAPSVTVGRDPDSDVVLRHARVSSQHAELSQAGGLLLLTDLGSKNGTRLNRVKLAPRTPTAIDVGDSVSFGPVAATLWGIADLYAAIG